MKFIGILFGLIILLVVGAGAYLFFFAGDVIKQGVEEFGPDYLGTSVNVDAVDMDFASGTGSVRGMAIGNPTGYEGPYSMKLDLLKTTLDTAQTTGDLVVIKDLQIDGASLAAIAKGSKTNLQQLMDNLEQALGSAGGTETSETGASETLFIVDKFSFTNADVSLDSDILGSKALTIPDINLSGIGRKSNGATAAEVAQQLMNPITEAVSKAVVAEGLDLEGVEQQLKDTVKEKIGDKLGNLKDLF